MPLETGTLPLRRILELDAATCVVTGLALLAAAGPVGRLTGIPVPLLFWAGASLLPIAVVMAIAARSVPPVRWMVGLIIAGNLLWIAASLLLPATGIIEPNALGWALLVGQAAVVAILTKLEYDAADSRIAAGIG